MKTDHTQGPWIYDPNAAVEIWPENGNQAIARLVGQRASFEHAANARLIAASPQLRSELIKAESFIAGFENDDSQEGIAELLSGIRAALAKTEKEVSHD